MPDEIVVRDGTITEDQITITQTPDGVAIISYGGLQGGTVSPEDQQRIDAALEALSNLPEGVGGQLLGYGPDGELIATLPPLSSQQW